MQPQPGALNDGLSLSLIGQALLSQSTLRGNLIAYQNYRCEKHAIDWQIEWCTHVSQVRSVVQLLNQLGLRGCDAGIVVEELYSFVALEQALLCVGASVAALDDRLLVATSTIPKLLFVPNSARKVYSDKSKVHLSSNIIYYGYHEGKLSLELENHQPLNFESKPEALGEIRTYTSGTTGVPKQLSFSVDQVILAANCFFDRFPQMQGEKRCAVWLPFTALYQRMLNFCALFAGNTAVLVDCPKRFVDVLPDIEPHYVFGVPSLYSELERKAHGLKERGSETYEIRRRLVGCNLEFAVSGSAKVSPITINSLAELGIPLLEAYGVSECIIPVAANSVDDIRVGTVGRPFKDQRINIQSDGRIMLESAGMAKEISSGRLTTEDYGMLDKEGYLTLTGRDGEFIKTSSGRKLPSALIESRFETLKYVSKAVVLSRDETNLFGILFIPSECLRPPESLAHDIQRINDAAPKIERIFEWYVVLRGPSEERGELTRTGKVRRRDLCSKIEVVKSNAQEEVIFCSIEAHSPRIKICQLSF